MSGAGQLGGGRAGCAVPLHRTERERLGGTGAPRGDRDWNGTGHRPRSSARGTRGSAGRTPLCPLAEGLSPGREHGASAPRSAGGVDAPCGARPSGRVDGRILPAIIAERRRDEGPSERLGLLGAQPQQTGDAHPGTDEDDESDQSHGTFRQSAVNVRKRSGVLPDPAQRTRRGLAAP